MLQKKWNELTAVDSEEVKRLCREWEMHPRVAEILLRRGLKTRR